MRALTICGPFRGPTGYDHHVREFVRELARQGVAVRLLDMPLWSPRRLPFALRDPWFETLHRPVAATTVLHFCMPHQVRPHAGLRNVNYTAFEATPAPPAWVARGLELDRVIVPTESSRAAWLAGGMPEARIGICPQGVDPRLFGRGAEPLPLRLPGGAPVSERRVRFLNISEMGGRKNLAGLLRTWATATDARDDAALVVKVGYGSPGEQQSFGAQAAALRLDSGKTLADAAPVQFVYDLFADSEMPRLYATATHYWSMSFGEGWDHPTVEAAASGLRLIVPRHSAYLSYLDDSVATLIGCREAPVRWTGDAATRALFENARWWEPDEDEAARHIRAAIEGRDAGQPTAQARILGTFSWERAVERLRAILSEFEPPRKRFWRFARAGAAAARAS